jgi:hypothetical protein
MFDRWSNPTARAMLYTSAEYWNPGSSAARGASLAPRTTAIPGSYIAPGATAGPYFPGDDIRNANSTLWGVGG